MQIGIAAILSVVMLAFVIAGSAFILVSNHSAPTVTTSPSSSTTAQSTISTSVPTTATTTITTTAIASAANTVNHSNSTENLTATANSPYPSSPQYADWHGNATVMVQGNYLIVRSNGVPTMAGNFPNANNPNRIEAQNYTFEIPLNPRLGPHSSPTPMGPIGIALNGVPFYNQYNANGQDAVKTKVFLTPATAIPTWTGGTTTTSFPHA